MTGEVMRLDYSVDAVIDRVEAVNKLYKSVMQDGQHFGKIPGAGEKPTLLKAGAEKICAMFSLSPKTIDKQVRDYPRGHREVIITIELVHRKTGETWGDGSGSCSTMEKKYRWRETWTPVRKCPKEYWADRNPELLDGMRTKKINDIWMLCTVEKLENEDIADVYNTVLKMAEKRALVSAVLKATGVSDIFTQDVEDMDLPDKNTNTPDTAEKPVTGQTEVSQSVSGSTSTTTTPAAKKMEIDQPVPKDYWDKDTAGKKAMIPDGCEVKKVGAVYKCVKK